MKKNRIILAITLCFLIQLPTSANASSSTPVSNATESTGATGSTGSLKNSSRTIEEAFESEFKINTPENKVPDDFFSKMKEESIIIADGRSINGSSFKRISYFINDAGKEGSLTLSYTGSYDTKDNFLEVGFFLTGGDTSNKDGFKNLVENALEPANTYYKVDSSKIMERVIDTIEDLKLKKNPIEYTIELNETTVIIKATDNNEFPSMDIRYESKVINTPSLEEIKAYNENNLGNISGASFSIDYKKEKESAIHFYSYTSNEKMDLAYSLDLILDEGVDYEKILGDFIDKLPEEVKKNKDSMVKKAIGKLPTVTEKLENITTTPFSVSLRKADYGKPVYVYSIDFKINNQGKLIE